MKHCLSVLQVFLLDFQVILHFVKFIFCISEKGKKAMSVKMEKLLLRLIKAEMVYTKSSSIVNDVVDEMPDNVTAEADDILQTCDGIAEVCI